MDAPVRVADAVPGDAAVIPARRRVGRRWLANAINRLNFSDGQVLFTFRHDDGSLVSVPARPNACLGEHLECTWVRRPPLAAKPAGWGLLHLHLADGLAQIEIPADSAAWDEHGVRLTLPEVAYDVGTRRSQRHVCRGVVARLAIGGLRVEGRLMSSGAASFAVLLKPGAPVPPSGEALDVELARGTKTLFAARCTVIRTTRQRSGVAVALRPPEGPVKKAADRYRCLRPHIAPLPLIVFRHPLSGTPVTLRALDISGAGFSVEEEASRGQLLPGLLLPRVRIEVASGFEFPCSARVVYNEPTADGGLRSGLAIEAMSLRDHTRLTSLLHLGEYRNSSVCTPHVDLEELWSFFFESGFIYPEKYAHIKDQRAHFIRLYRNLYNRTPRIARHIIYQDRGAILGHIAMFRWYPATWILHHHAAVTSTRHRAGLVVMEQMMRYIQEFHRLFPALMRYVACYYRSGNRFGARAFGGAVRALGNRRCSLDAFAYFHLRETVAPAKLPDGWILVPAAASDLAALRHAYARDSGGLMIEGLALREEDLPGEAPLSAEYARLGFRRERRLYALRRSGTCAGLISVNRSDLGLNLSDLTNGLQAFVLEPALLDGATLLAALRTFAGGYSPGAATVLLYPRSYADEQAIAYDKGYDLTVLDLEHIGPLLDFLDDLLVPARRSPPAIAVG